MPGIDFMHIISLNSYDFEVQVIIPVLQRRDLRFRRISKLVLVTLP